MFTEAALRTLLQTPPPQLELHETIDSTNLRCKALGEADAAEGTVVIAAHQTAGRGRMGRSFFSPADTGLYMSLLLRPDFPPTEALSITACAAVCVSEAIEALTGRTCGIKWVNDVYIEGKKVCGILTEAAFVPDGSRLRYAVLGIGVNILPPEGDFPPELADIAASLFDHSDSSDVAIDLRARLAAEILNRFFGYYPTLPEKPFFDGYRDRLFLRGQPIEILWGNGAGSGVCLDVDRDLRLLVRLEDGTTEALHSGEVRVRPAR